MREKVGEKPRREELLRLLADNQGYHVQVFASDAGRRSSLPGRPTLSFLPHVNLPAPKRSGHITDRHRTRYVLRAATLTLTLREGQRRCTAAPSHRSALGRDPGTWDRAGAGRRRGGRGTMDEGIFA